jgi:PAS domain S-box-containing protein
MRADPARRAASVISDSSGRITAWADLAEQILGYTAAEAVGRSVEMLIAPVCRPLHRAGYELAVATGRLKNAPVGTVPMVHKDGSTRMLQFHTSLLEIDGRRHVRVELTPLSDPS